MSPRTLIALCGLSTALAACKSAPPLPSDECDGGLPTCDINGVQTCVDLDTDPGNCGYCGNACLPGQSCIGGFCSCGQEAYCTTAQENGGAPGCYALNVDPNNCGVCGNACPTGQLCLDGGCGAQCEMGQTSCEADGGPYCATLTIDVNNCGTCGKSCDKSFATGSICDAGACACAGETTACSGACVNEKTDVDNCGACSVKCGAGQTCQDGGCAATCGRGATLCGADGGNPSCADLNLDANNCGACGVVCDVGASCRSGVCTCPGGEVDCDGMTTCASGHCGDGGACTNLTEDPNNCSSCGAACTTPDLFCTDGLCAARCQTNEKVCVLRGANLCVDPQTDDRNCGACGVACDPGASCVAGACTCPSGETDCVDAGAACANNACGGACTDTQSDPLNCATCGNVCPANQAYCTAGACNANCMGNGETLCGTECVNAQSDDQNCGGCGIACDLGAKCVSGTCTCQPGYIDCLGDEVCDGGACGDGGACTNIKTDPNNCGVCGDICPSTDPYCGGGICTGSCSGAGDVLCQSGCSDTYFDSQNCGGCGLACPAGGTCGYVARLDAGSCTCPANYPAACAASCANLQNDPQNCGSCGNVCGVANDGGANNTLAPYCSNGGCVSGCAGEQIQCGNACATLASDPNNCGGCGVVCDPGATCVGGSCRCSLANQVDCAPGGRCLSGHCAGGSACTNLATDPDNCGICGGLCLGQTPYCVTDSCQSTCSGPGATICFINGANQCVDALTDNANCGGCGIACDPGAGCSQGLCQCQANNVDCLGVTVVSPADEGGSCTDLSDDPNNCGICGTACPVSSPFCAAGMCSGTCMGGGAEVCNNACVDVNQDNQNCGSCGTVCDTGATCANGSCGCPSGESDCGPAGGCGSAECGPGNACTNTNEDPNNCGNCGIFCGPNATCTGGGCVCLEAGTPDSCINQAGTGYDCTNTQTDVTNCGNCGTVCAPSGGDGGDCCSGNCKDFQTDPANCGACGNSCGSGVCDAGTCLGGLVLVTGGQNNSGTYLQTAEIYNENNNTWTLLDAGMTAPRAWHLAEPLASGLVVLAGGQTTSGANITSSELFNPTSGSFGSVASMTYASNAFAGVTLMQNGGVLVAGGGTPSANAALYAPGSNTWSAVGSMPTAMNNFTLTLLPSGNVITTSGAAGCCGANQTTASFLYNTTSQTWSTDATLAQRVIWAASAPLQNGQVLLVGGMLPSFGVTAECELYNPTAHTWTQTGSLNTVRRNLTAIALANGYVLAIGGNNANGAPNADNLTTAELFNPDAGTWAYTTGSLNDGRETATASLLPDGKVLVVGGTGLDGGYLSSAELYNPTTQQFTRAGWMSTGRNWNTETTLTP